MNNKIIDELITRALAEDCIGRDVTTNALIKDNWQGQAYFLAKAEGVLAGIEIARRVFIKTDSSLKFAVLIKDGQEIKSGDIIARVNGRLSSILKAERTALNFLQHLSGIATETSRYVAAVKGLPVKILDTRKTTPGLRILEKYAVKTGGGQNHRMDLSDSILIKDNHLAILHKQRISLKEAIATATQKAPAKLKIEVEVQTPQAAKQAVEAGTDIIMLDNMNPADMKQAVKLVNKRASIEASGGITLANVRAVAETGVDYISIGALTHSVKALDISLEYEDI
ncbi:MAG: carboxylating nicotinate-nucleotide diphosphorylase [Dehalococcoidales bacterium]|nr:carboxylating nicotinate-nucleotide diphosphorylase [Dehalococcoidales bacterium]